MLLLLLLLLLLPKASAAGPATLAQTGAGPGSKEEAEDVELEVAIGGSAGMRATWVSNVAMPLLVATGAQGATAAHSPAVPVLVPVPLLVLEPAIPT